MLDGMEASEVDAIAPASSDEEWMTNYVNNGDKEHEKVRTSQHLRQGQILLPRWCPSRCCFSIQEALASLVDAPIPLLFNTNGFLCHFNSGILSKMFWSSVVCTFLSLL